MNDSFNKEFPEAFPKAFPEAFPELDADWLAPHYTIPNAKFPLITALVNRLLPPPCPQAFDETLPEAFSEVFPKAFLGHFLRLFLRPFPSWMLIG